ncbi:tetraacyldisaccharide 4'-kinase [Salegentibacter chungangensis]|uniref:Tetraacyldisaccharide 4'-kinase n=1 Tax=Salegentibacter chungangensis TaxID=1335724 RepID=A0ABW3NV29_9FLAO
MKSLRKLLFPFALLYGAVTWIRNQFYNSGILSSRSYDLPVICVGNLNTGGTGKSPMIEYLLKLVSPKYRTAALSRGYKRSTRGFKLLRGNESAAEAGDEPLQFKRNFGNALVAVDADRRNGIAELLKQEPEVILLDDAFQHRKVKAGLNILLTSYGDLYTEDFMLPAGNLREPTVGAERADIIVVTKCPLKLTSEEQERIWHKLRLRNYQKLFFTGISYDENPRNADGEADWEELSTEGFCLVTGIANPKPLLEHLKGKDFNYTHRKFPDHHNFTERELNELKEENLILTTEKDYVRLKDELPPDKLFYLPIKVTFIKGKEEFDKNILDYIKEKEV